MYNDFRIPLLERNHIVKTIKHLCEEERIYIVNSLNADFTVTQIAKAICKDPTTVSKEIKKHRVLKIPHGTTGFYNTCKHLRSCTKTNICSSHDKCNTKLCKTCNICSSVCHDFEKTYARNCCVPHMSVMAVQNFQIVKCTSNIFILLPLLIKIMFLLCLLLEKVSI